MSHVETPNPPASGGLSAAYAGPFGAFEYDVASNRVTWSPPVELLYGVSAGTFGGTYEAWRALVHPDDRDKFDLDCAGCETAPTFSEFRIARPDGEIRWVASQAQSILDAEGRVLRRVGVNFDITQRKLAEQRAYDLCAVLQKIADSSPDLLAYVDAQEHYVFLNQTYQTWLGHPTGEIRGRHMREVIGEAYERLRPYVKAALGGESVTFEELVPYQEGTPRHIHATYAPDFDDGGRVRGFMVYVSDVTERREMEARLRERAAAEHALRQQLSEVDRRKDLFLATLAHELRNPLAPIRNAVAITRQTQDETARRNAMAIIDRQANHLARLVDDLLDLSRITRGRLELRRDPVTIADVVRTAVETTLPLFEGMNQRLSTHLPEEPIVVDGDAVRLSQAIANLLSNAARYTPRNGLIDLRVEYAGDTVSVVVKDTGCGISGEALPHIFDPFYQAEHALRSALGGLGIGLTLVRSVIEKHGGTVQARSDGEGKGSEFTIRLPISEKAAAPPRRDRGPASVTPAIRILVADDNRDAADSLAFVLRAVGHEVVVANDGAIALAEATRMSPDLCILDIGMPLRDGLDVARAVRALFGHERPKLIALTGWGQPSDRARTTAAGFDRHLTKPADIHQLTALIAEWFGRLTE